MRATLLTLSVAALVLGPLPCRATEASTAMLEAALAAMQIQRDTAANQVVQLSAELTLARREVERLLKETAAKQPPEPGEIKKDETK